MNMQVKLPQVRGYSEQDVRTIARMIGEQATASEIGKSIGRSRNAIIGLISRHFHPIGIELARSPGPEFRGKSPSGYPKPRKRNARPKRQEIPDEQLAAYHLTARRLTLMQIGTGECRWPVNDDHVDGQHLFCGHKTDGTSSYCKIHRAIGTQPPRGKAALSES